MRASGAGSRGMSVRCISNCGRLIKRDRGHKKSVLERGSIDPG
jgi:hypothetical protein